MRIFERYLKNDKKRNKKIQTVTTWVCKVSVESTKQKRNTAQRQAQRETSHLRSSSLPNANRGYMGL